MPSYKWYNVLQFQLGETKFPVQPSNEPKVVVPQIPFNSGIKTQPTKLIPISTVVVPDNKLQDPKTTASTIFSSSRSVSPFTDTTERSTIRPSISTKIPSIGVNVNGPEYDTKISYRQQIQQSTTEPSSHPTRFQATLPPFRESIKVSEPSTVKVPSDTLKLQKVISSSSEGPYDNTEGLLPPFPTTILFDTQTTTARGVPFNSYNTDKDLNAINSYANLNPESGITTQGFYSTFVFIYSRLQFFFKKKS